MFGGVRRVQACPGAKFLGTLGKLQYPNMGDSVSHSIYIAVFGSENIFSGGLGPYLFGKQGPLRVCLLGSGDLPCGHKLPSRGY